MAILDFQLKWESTYKMLLNELVQQNTVVQEQIATWMKNGLEPARVPSPSSISEILEFESVDILNFRDLFPLSMSANSLLCRRRRRSSRSRSATWRARR